ncbi:hypothetical protein GEMRC1_004826 [Eukaryota sp. GEM-RC1]
MSHENLYQDQTNISFHDPGLIHALGGLNLDNVLHYFYFSSFYDPSSINELLRVQQMDMSHLHTMPGTSFEVRANLSQPPDLFVIQKVFRDNSLKPVTVCYFYIRNGVVYQVPFALQVFQSRIHNISFSLRSLLSKISSETVFPGKLVIT